MNLSEAVFEAITAAESVYANPVWTRWARHCKSSATFYRALALEASAIAGAEADEEAGRRHFAALAAFHAATAAAWAAAGEETAALRSCESAKRNANRARSLAARNDCGSVEQTPVLGRRTETLPMKGPAPEPRDDTR
jgi:hypothetical protein